MAGPENSIHAITTRINESPAALCTNLESISWRIKTDGCGDTRARRTPTAAGDKRSSGISPMSCNSFIADHKLESTLRLLFAYDPLLLDAGSYLYHALV